MRRSLLAAMDWLEAHLRLRDEAAGCVFVGLAALLLTLLLFVMQGCALWVSPAAASHFRPDLLPAVQTGTAVLIGFYAAMAWYGWQRYRSREPQRKAAYLLTTTMLLTAVLFTLLYGLHDTPFGLMLLAAVALVRAWFPVRVLLPGLLLGGLLLVGGELLSQRGLMPYAPLLSAPVMTGAAVAPWWMGWFMAVYYLGSLFFAALMLLMFSIMRRHHAQLEDLTHVDALTGLLNRATFMRQLEEECKKQLRTQRPGCVLLCDVDHFKHVNDSYGHPAGDLVLVRVGSLLRQIVAAPVEVAARYGGEEFVILLPEADLATGLGMAERLREQLKAQVFETEERRFSVTLSIGVAEYRQGDGEAALRVADANLYQAKQEGRDRVVATVVA